MIRIIGFGNPLHGDDGFGPAVIGALAGRLRLPGVEVGEGGAPGLSALSLFEGCETVLIVDALKDGGPVGEIGWVDRHAVIATASSGALHGGSLAEMLRLLPLAMTGGVPRIDILLARIAVAQPFHPGLSPQVARAVDQAAARIEARVLSLRGPAETPPAPRAALHG